MSDNNCKRSRVIDLSFPVHEGMTTFPTRSHPVVEVTILARHGIENRETRKLVLGSHTGTHCDAPRHFIPEGGTIDQIDPNLLLGPALMLDFSDMAELHEVNETQLAKALGDDRPERVVLRFDWHRSWGQMAYYSRHPFLSMEAAQLLVDYGVHLVAMDTPSPDNPNHGHGAKQDSPVHKILLGNEVILVEYLCNLDTIGVRHFDLVVAPLPVREGDGAPARCYAVRPNQKEGNRDD